MERKEHAILLLKLGLAFCFLYAGIATLVRPEDWIGFYPPLLRSYIPAGILVSGFSLYQLGLSIGLIVKKYTFPAAVLASLTLLGIIFSNFGQMDLIFRDISILFAALALAVLVK